MKDEKKAYTIVRANFPIEADRSNELTDDDASVRPYRDDSTNEYSASQSRNRPPQPETTKNKNQLRTKEPTTAPVNRDNALPRVSRSFLSVYRNIHFTFLQLKAKLLVEAHAALLPSNDCKTNFTFVFLHDALFVG